MLYLFGAFVGLVLLLILWAAVIAPGRTRKLFSDLQTQGWERVERKDAGLRAALGALRPFDLTSYVFDPAAPPSARIDSALGRAGPRGARYLVQLRVQARDTLKEYETSFNTLALGLQSLALGRPSVYILDRTLEPNIGSSAEVLGLRRVESGLDPGFAGLFLVFDGGGGDLRLPSALQQALLASAALFVYGAGERGRYLPRVCLRLAPAGWALLVPEPITTRRQLRAFLDAADAVSDALASATPS